MAYTLAKMKNVKPLYRNLLYRWIRFAYPFFLVFITPLGVIAAIFTLKNNLVMPWHIVSTLTLIALSGLGITLGYHRLTTHRSFKTYPWIKTILLLQGTLAMQGPPIAWASLHIQHHSHADKMGDPHSPKVNSFWYSHCFWIFNQYKPNLQRYGKWLMKDKEVMWVSKNYHYFILISLMLPLFFGWVAFIWITLVRLFISCHGTWFINSLCHKIGQKSHETNDNSKNNLLVALITFGEGWHNNHHRFPQSPYLGLKWHEIDIGKYVLYLLSKGKVIWGLKIPSSH